MKLKKSCPADCRQLPDLEEQDLINQTGMAIDELRALRKTMPDFFNDDDKDGLLNGIEKIIDTNPKNSSSNGETDTDKDGATDLQEYIAKTDSKDSNSKPS